MLVKRYMSLTRKMKSLKEKMRREVEAHQRARKEIVERMNIVQRELDSDPIFTTSESEFKKEWLNEPAPRSEQEIGPGNRGIVEVPSGRNRRQDTKDNKPI